MMLCPNGWYFMLGVVGVLCLYVGGLTVVITREIVREYYEHRTEK